MSLIVSDISRYSMSYPEEIQGHRFQLGVLAQRT